MPIQTGSSESPKAPSQLKSRTCVQQHPYCGKTPTYNTTSPRNTDRSTTYRSRGCSQTDLTEWPSLSRSSICHFSAHFTRLHPPSLPSFFHYQPGCWAFCIRSHQHSYSLEGSKGTRPVYQVLRKPHRNDRCGGRSFLSFRSLKCIHTGDLHTQPPRWSADTGLPRFRGVDKGSRAVMGVSPVGDTRGDWSTKETEGRALDLGQWLTPSFATTR
ncbi:hypothetical protein P280DRAFT_41684 [Massarina eburnea CBS 473.64]|uniref:Uncharacterized protein n=1 Tax=Massarina eburnea CBS 473.64 TaxID=1395130 RepID=A0A6A6RXU9_9PLEO|nr:hypothetical protein P280DRAFT_41684 [Massarina eburnea CBS 473.64]